jgi:hypothetical protein
MTEQIEKMQAEMDRYAREHCNRMWALLEKWFMANPGKTPMLMTWYDDEDETLRSAWRSRD